MRQRRNLGGGGGVAERRVVCLERTLVVPVAADIRGKGAGQCRIAVASLACHLSIGRVGDAQLERDHRPIKCLACLAQLELAVLHATEFEQAPVLTVVGVDLILERFHRSGDDIARSPVLIGQRKFAPDGLLGLVIECLVATTTCVVERARIYFDPNIRGVGSNLPNPHITCGFLQIDRLVGFGVDDAVMTDTTPGDFDSVDT